MLKVFLDDPCDANRAELDGCLDAVQGPPDPETKSPSLPYSVGSFLTEEREMALALAQSIVHRTELDADGAIVSMECEYIYDKAKLLLAYFGRNGK